MNYIHIPSVELEQDRQVVRTRLALTRNSARCKNRMKAILKLHGIEIPNGYSKSKWSSKLNKWLLGLELGSSSVVMGSLVRELECLNTEKVTLEKKLLELSGSDRYSKWVELLLKVPGVGLLTAMIILTEIGDIKRFKWFDELCSYCGFSPDCHSSGEEEHVEV